MNLPKETVLTIYIPNQGFVAQGKFCLIDSKLSFVANMTPVKLWRNYNGYSISRRLLEELPRGTQIIYKRVDLNQYYIANKSLFQKKGILLSYGNHSQWVLPLKNWKTVSGKLQNEPTNLPVTDLEKWKSSWGPSSTSFQVEPVQAPGWASIPRDKWESLRLKIRGADDRLAAVS